MLGGLLGFLIGLINIQSIESIPFIFLSGFVAFSFFLIPGISGSAILVSIGSYEIIINSISTGYLPVLSAFLMGAIISLILMPKLIKRIYFKQAQKVDSFFAGLIIYSGVILF